MEKLYAAMLCRKNDWRLRDYWGVTVAADVPGVGHCEATHTNGGSLTVTTPEWEYQDSDRHHARLRAACGFATEVRELPEAVADALIAALPVLLPDSEVPGGCERIAAIACA